PVCDIPAGNPCPQVMLVGFRLSVGTASQRVPSRGCDFKRQKIQRLSYDLILQPENVGGRSGQAASPDLPICMGVDQAAVDAQLRSRLLQAAFEDQVNTEFAPRIFISLDTLRFNFAR